MTILSSEADGLGYYFGFVPGDRRRVDVKRGEAHWRAWVDGVELANTYRSKAEAEAAAVALIASTPENADAG